jgi:cobalamin-dependent methionine synthase I
MSEEAASPGAVQSVEELVALAKEIFEKAMKHGFKPEQIFFDSTVFPLAIDMPMQPGVPGYTYRAFETIKAIKNDPAMKGVHFSMGVSNCARDLPGRRIGVCRAYVEKAMEYGLDAGIVNATHKYGTQPADAKLVELVAAYAAMDGDMDKTNEAIDRMGEFCDSCRK